MGYIDGREKGRVGEVFETRLWDGERQHGGSKLVVIDRFAAVVILILLHVLRRYLGIKVLLHDIGGLPLQLPLVQ